eukprot:SAG11_NODE_2520_length_3263_cov_2.014223_1_plen_70_part_00
MDLQLQIPEIRVHQQPRGPPAELDERRVRGLFFKLASAAVLRPGFRNFKQLGESVPSQLLRQSVWCEPR